jgi:glutathione peroxidase
MTKNAYDFEFNKIDGSGKVRLKDYKGKPIIIVNTASLCGFTKQYAELEGLWQKYKDRGLIVIAVPANNFGKQEPGANKEIADFCDVNFNISFLITEKVDVISNNSHPFFNWTREKFGWLSGPKWNFYKYIINKDGEPIAWFSSITSPTSNKLINIINQSLSNANK